MSPKMSPVVHFEMPADDARRMSSFYEKVFGWQTQHLGPEMGHYVLATTGESGEDGIPKQPGIINGGFFKKSEDNAHPSVVISVEDIREAMARVREAGGQVLGGQQPGEPDEIPGVGLYASFVDTEGNRVGMLQPATWTP